MSQPFEQQLQALLAAARHDISEEEHIIAEVIGLLAMNARAKAQFRAAFGHLAMRPTTQQGRPAHMTPPQHDDGNLPSFLQDVRYPH